MLFPESSKVRTLWSDYPRIAERPASQLAHARLGISYFPSKSIHRNRVSVRIYRVLNFINHPL